MWRRASTPFFRRAIGSRRARGIALVVLVASTVSALTAVGALAVFPDDNVTSFAACLNIVGSASGTFSQVAVGDSPAKPCGSNQMLVHLSGGDITSVSAGSGLTGGGTNGAVTLAVDPLKVQTRVTGECIDPGEAINTINKDGTAGCSEGPSAHLKFVQEGGSVPDQFETIGSLALPAGTFLLIAKVFVEQEEPTSQAPNFTVLCTLNGDAQTASVFTSPTDFFTPGGTVTMIGAEVLASPGTASVECRDLGDQPLNADAKWLDLAITAIKLGGLLVTPSS